MIFVHGRVLELARWLAISGPDYWMNIPGILHKNFEYAVENTFKLTRHSSYAGNNLQRKLKLKQGVPRWQKVSRKELGATAALNIVKSGRKVIDLPRQWKPGFGTIPANMPNWCNAIYQPLALSTHLKIHKNNFITGIRESLQQWPEKLCAKGESAGRRFSDCTRSS